jgi:polyvinyl alcohol dehydrogenase (cytochrome)
VTGTVIAVKRADGSLKWKAVVDPHPLAHITASLVVNGNSVYVGVASSGEGDAIGWYFCDQATGGAPFCESDYRSFRGSVVSLDKETGNVNWKTYTTPEPPPGYEPEDWFSGVAVWGSHLAIDSKRGAIYVTTGNNYYLPADLMNCIASGMPEDDCLAAWDVADNYVDSILSLSLGNGNVNWATKLQGYDAWTVPCNFFAPRPYCPQPNGPDYDFAQGAMTWSAKVDGKNTDLVGAAGKSGIFWALDRDTGQVVWANEDGTGDLFGGSQWGSATNGKMIVVPNTVPMSDAVKDALPAGAESCTESGYWRGIDAGTGITDWFSCGPVGGEGRVISPVSISQDVAFAGSLEAGTANMVVLDLSDGSQIRTFPKDGVANGFSSNSAPSIVDGSIYWTSGFGGFMDDVVGNDKVYAFELP